MSATGATRDAAWACRTGSSFFPVRATAAVLLVSAGLQAGELELRPGDLPHFPPVDPEHALATFQVRPGFHFELAAHEPQVVDPIALSFDADGRLYVAEMRDYSERRPERLGRIRQLEDRDGDGFFETSSIFLDGLPWPTAVTCYEGGIFVGATPDILYARDTDGDGRAELRETVFTGFASEYAPFETNRLNVQAMMNSFQWGLDNRIHGATSLAGGRVRRLDSAFTRAWLVAHARNGVSTNRSRVLPGRSDKQVELRDRDFSFDPRTLELRAENGGGQHGMSHDNTGRKFVCSNSDHLQQILYEARQAARNPSYPLPPARISIAVDGPAAEVFRISPEEPWRILRTRWRVSGLVAGPIEGGGRASGYFTGATGVTIYRGDAWGPEHVGEAFIADCGSNLIHRKKLEPKPDGIELLGARPPDEQRAEFAASTDTWFRPVQFANAPDGNLWVADMYREIIEHPWSLPPSIKRLLDLNAGNDRGRLYRIVRDRNTRRRRATLEARTTPELVAALEHPNGWHRDTAARLLYEQQDPSAVPLLRAALGGSTNSLGRLHALYALDGLGATSETDLLAALRDSSPNVRCHAVRLAEPRVERGSPPDSVLAQVFRLADDADPLVRYQLAFALGATRDPRRIETLVKLIVSATEQNGGWWLRHAALSAVGEDVIQVWKKVAPLGETAPGAAEVLPRLAGMVGRRNRSDEVTVVIGTVARQRADLTSLQMVTGLADGLRQGGGSLARAELAGRLSPIMDLARDIVTRPPPHEHAPGEVVAAIRLLGHLPVAESTPLLRSALQPNQSIAALQAAAAELLRLDERRGVESILESWPAIAPEARGGVSALLVQRRAGAAALLEAIAAGRIDVGDLRADQVAALRNHPNAAIQSRARALFGAPAESRAAAIAATLPALDLSGDAGRGREVYRALCAACHRFSGEGYALGPDLESVRSQGREKVLVAIIDPNREVAPNFMSRTVETDDGESLTGFVTSETVTGVTLRQAGGMETMLPREKVKRLVADGRSLMPEGFESGLSVQELADLLQYITETGNGLD